MAGMPDRQGSLPEFASSRDVQDTSEDNVCCPRTRGIFKTISENDKFRLVASLLLGQVLSLLLCGTGVMSQMLETKHSITVPTTQSFLNYVFLGAAFGVPLAVRKDFLKVLRQNWWKYILLGVIDVEANYMIVRAYEFTNLTTIQLLDSFTIACVMVLSFFFLRIRYKLINLMGISLALIGIVCIVLATVTNSSSGPNPLIGDLLCLGGSALYAISNVAQEFLVKNHSIVEFLGLLGVSGSFVSGVQLIVLERKSLARIDWSYEIGLLFIGFAVCMFLFYSLMPHVMKFSSAVVVNLSLLTADIYTFFFGLYLFHFMFSFFYIVALFLIITGIFIYNIKQPQEAKKTEDKKKPTKSYASTSKPLIGPPSDTESPKPPRKRLLLRELLESSNFETSAAADAKKRPPRKKRLSQRDSSTFSLTAPATSEGLPLAQSAPVQTARASSSSTMPRSSSYNYGSMSLTSTIPTSPSTGSVPETPRQQRTSRRSGRRSSASKSKPIPIVKNSTE